MVNSTAWGGGLLLITASTRRCTICGRDRRTHRRHLEIYESAARSWQISGQSLCARCAPRLELAARHGGAVMARGGNLILGLVPGPDAPPVPAGGPQRAAEHIPSPVDPIAVAVGVLCLILIISFGVLATFTSPIFFLGVVLTFIPLAVVASRSS